MAVSDLQFRSVCLNTADYHSLPQMNIDHICLLSQITSVVTVPGSCNSVGGGGFLDPPLRWRWYTVFSPVVRDATSIKPVNIPTACFSIHGE